MNSKESLRARLLWIILAALALLALRPSRSDAASRFWDGSSSGNFSTGANWVGGVAPVAGDDLVFQAGVAQLLVTNDFSPNRAFSTVLFQGSNYFVRGNALLITNGISSINVVGRNTIDADVDVRASQPWEATGSLGELDINGNINLNANTLTVRAATGDFFFSGVVSGTGGILKTNVGTLRMDGLAANTYTGTTVFSGGVLDLAKTNNIAIPGDLIVGDGNNLLATDVLRLFADEQIANTSDVTVKNSGLFDMNGFDEHIGALTMQGGTIDSEGGTFFLGGNLATLTDNNTAFIEGHLSLGGASRTFTINSGPAVPDLRINAVISGDAISIFVNPGFTKNGAGTVNLAGTNTYNGTTFINEGQLALLSDRALGATATPLGASAGVVVNSNGNLFISGVQVTNENLTVNSPNAGGAFNASGASVWTGDILLNTNTFISSSGSFLLSGDITGVGGFTKLSAGSLTLGGTNANTYTGTTTVRDGTLFLDKDTTAVLDGAMSGPLVVGEDELPEGADVVRFLHCCQLPDDTDITLNASGLLDLNGFGDNVRNLIFNGGDVDAPSPGSILPVGDITVNTNANSQAVISGRMSVLSNPIINVTGHYFSPDLQIDAHLFGAGAFTKNGVGEVGLTASNAYTGTTTLNDGFVLVDNSFALGATNGGTVVNSGAVLALRNDSRVAGEALTLAGAGQSTFGALSSSFGSNSWSGNVTLSADATVFVDAADFLNLSGTVSGANDLTKTGTGTLILSGGTANSFAGLLHNSGTLVLDKTVANVAGFTSLALGDGAGGALSDVLRFNRDNQIADSTPVTMLSSALFDLNDMIDTVGSIGGSGRIDLGSGTLRAGSDNGTAAFSGLIIGTGSLFKLGNGTWTLNANNTYTGLTTVSAGTLAVNGSQPQSPVVVNGTATLAGSGVIGHLQVFGSITPGASPGTLTTSNVNFASQGDWFVELNGAAPGTGYDQLNVRGTNNLGSATLHVSVGAGFAPFEGEEFIILNNDGAEAIVGTFNGLANNSVLTANGLQFRIRYFDTFGNDVILTVTNTAARLLGATVTSGNGALDANECGTLNVVLTNVSGGTLSGVTATLVPLTPGVSVTVGTAAYPSIPVNGQRTNATPFQFSTGPGFVCGTIVNFNLVVQTAANGSFTIPFSLASPVNCANGGGGCESCPENRIIRGTLGAGSLVQSNRLNRNGIASTCGAAKICPGVLGPLESRAYDAYVFENGESNACVTVTLQSLCGSSLFSAAYTNAYNPLSLCQNYLADAGTSTTNASYSFNVGRGARFVIVVHEVNAGTGCDYTLGVTGGSCRPFLNITSLTNNQVRLDWSTAALGYALESTNRLTGPGHPVWPPVTNAPVITGGRFRVTNDLVLPPTNVVLTNFFSTNFFYQLRKP